MQQPIPAITVEELHTRLESGEDICLLDVREPFELQISVLPDIVSVPMDTIPQRLLELPKEKTMVVVCRTGNRSGLVTQYLRSVGFPLAVNLAGGMNDWARTIDPSLPTY